MLFICHVFIITLILFVLCLFGWSIILILIVTGNVRGLVKFWDLRSMRTFKTFEVHKSPLTALAVHSCAPVIATGSHAQFIKILTLGGDQLGRIIKYHDGFLGQRIGPVSCLAFHPTRMKLAAGATDSIVSIYTTAADI